MRRQPPSGQPAYHIFNLGFSAWGRKLSATACTHKSTKTALSALTEALGDDLRAAGEAWACAYPTHLVGIWCYKSGCCMPVAMLHLCICCTLQAYLPLECTTYRQAWY